MVCDYTVWVDKVAFGEMHQSYKEILGIVEERAKQVKAKVIDASQEIGLVIPVVIWIPRKYKGYIDVEIAERLHIIIMKL